MLQALTSRTRVDICDENLLLTRSRLLRGDGCPPDKRYTFCEVETLDGSVLPAQAPRYQVHPAESEYPAKYESIAGDPCVKVIDFGNKYVHSIYYGHRIDFNCQAPEVVFGSHFSPSADIWSLGCTVLDPLQFKS